MAGIFLVLPLNPLKENKFEMELEPKLEMYFIHMGKPD